MAKYRTGPRKKKKKISRRDSSVRPSDVLKLLQKEDRPMQRKEILTRMGLRKMDRHALEDALYQLAREGKTIKLKRGAWGLMDRMRILTGRLEVTRSGVGFVIPDDGRRQDIFISPRNIGEAWHGDRVAVALIPALKGKGRGESKKPEGRVVRVLERGRDVLPCLVLKSLGEGDFLVRPADAKLDFNILAGTERVDTPPALGDVVLVAPGDRLEYRLWDGEIAEVMGPENETSVQEHLVKVNNMIPMKFPEQVLKEAETFPDLPDEADFAGREDLRDLDLVTIDGAKARDFDDAVLVRRTGTGYSLLVAIADVAHYVLPGSALDEEAEERGNSYYFPASVEPMLPKKLSNGLCSLNPDVPRLCMCAEMEFDSQGHRKGAQVFQGVMQSSARLTYAQVYRAVIQKEPEERENLKGVLPMLEIAEELARMLKKGRSLRGSMDFDLPEPDILFNISGETVDIRPKARNFAHQIIEEFMIAANEAVAEFLENHESPCMYRIHPPPDGDKLKQLFKLLERTPLGEVVPKEATPQSLQKLLADAEETDLEFLVNRLTLRTMKQALYAPSNQGHFGLASGCYCHFTSPIRRYADLVVHRLVKNVLHAQDAPSTPIPGHKRLTRLGGHLSDRERKAMEAEREILKRLTILFLRERIGEEFTGVVSSMSDFGFFVELSEVMAEGLVRLSTMQDDYYAFWPDRQIIVGENTGRALRLGERISVVLEDVNMARLEVNLAFKSGGTDFKNAI